MTKNPSVYLAVTSDLSYWGNSQVVAINPSVLRPSMKAEWGGRVDCILDLQPANGQRAAAHREYLGATAERWTARLGRCLNVLHSESNSDRYWRIILGYWMHTFVCVIFDRYCRLIQAKSLAGDALISVEQPRSPRATDDVASFIQKLKTDRYNQLIYSDIAEMVWPRDQQVPVWNESNATIESYRSTSDVRSAPKIIAEIIRKYTMRRGIVTRSILASPKAQALLAVRSRGRVWPAFPESHPLPSPCEDIGARASITGQIDPSDTFEAVASELLPRYLPKSFLEGYRSTSNAALREFGPFPKCVASANGWYHEQTFVFWASRAAEQGAELVGIQHGGNYGSADYHPSEQHELAICDRYLSWGWTTLRRVRAKVIACPAFKLTGRKPVGPRHAKLDVLFGATHSHRYPVTYSPLELHFAEYIEWQRRFCVSLAKDLHPVLRLRAHDEDLGWDLPIRWKEWLPSIRQETWRIPFIESLHTSRIYVCDHLSTTFIEALAINMPTILFWSASTNPVRVGAMPAYNMLKEIGILYDSPEAAADAVGRLYPEIDEWWSADSLQQGRQQFLTQFGRTGPYGKAIDTWLSAIDA